MPIKSKYLFVVSMDVDPDKEALFNEVYDSEHVPNLLQVPGVHAAARMAGEPFVLNIGGEEKRIAQDGPRYTALYEIDGPQCWSAANGRRPPKEGAGPTKCAPTPATGGTRSTSWARALPSSAGQSIARAMARAAPVGAGDVEAEEHDLARRPASRLACGSFAMSLPLRAGDA